MAKEKQKTTQGSKKRTLVILLVLLLLAGVCVLAGYIWLEIKEVKSQVAENVTGETSVVQHETAPVYVPLETFTVSLKPESDNSDHVLYIGLTLRLQDNQAKETLEKFLPEVRSRLLLLFAQQTATTLTTDDGKVQLIEQIKNTISDPLAGKQSVGVTDVLFNAFILR
ncbi:MAG: flagellar basal body-associated protein FliL [Enterobacteriaceae bacterium]|jgi:flagellar FliL protein|nr:flagellar basal body-associated protein FliL [Enterobacteriaceae bacterium]